MWHVGSLDSTDRKRLLPEPSIAGFSAPDQLVVVRDRNILAYRIDLARLEIIGDPTLVAEDVARAGPSAALAVSERGAVVYWSGGQDITQPTWVQRDGTPVGTVGPPAAYMNLALSQDGRRAALDRFDTPGIWLLDVGRGTLTRSTFGKAYESTPIWAPDGRSFAFAAAGDAPPNLFLKRLDAAGEDERLFRTSLQSFPQSWSADGRFIAYLTVNPKTAGDIWMLPLAGDRKPVPLIETPYFESFARISPDGRWLAYVSNESGSHAVYATRFPQPAGKWPVSTGGGSFPVWRRDGRELFYRAPDGTLMSVAVKTGSDFEAAAPAALFSPRATPGSLGFGTFYDVAPDGRFLINMFVERSTSPATVVLNWPAAVTRPEAAR